MNPNVRAMLEEVYGLFNRKFDDQEMAWDRFMEFLAGDHSAHVIDQLGHGFTWLLRDKELTKSILRIYDAFLLSSDYYDHLGDMYYEKFNLESEANKLRLSFQPKNIEGLLAATSLSHTGGSLNILDPKAGTGRLLMTAHKYAPNCLLFGAEPDIRAMRIAFTNLAIHNIPCFLLHADSTIHETDISTENGEYNWKYANNWYSSIDELRPLSIVKSPYTHN